MSVSAPAPAGSWGIQADFTAKTACSIMAISVADILVGRAPGRRPQHRGRRGAALSFLSKYWCRVLIACDGTDGLGQVGSKTLALNPTPTPPPLCSTPRLSLSFSSPPHIFPSTLFARLISLRQLSPLPQPIPRALPMLCSRQQHFPVPPTNSTIASVHPPSPSNRPLALLCVRPPCCMRVSPPIIPSTEMMSKMM